MPIALGVGIGVNARRGGAFSFDPSDLRGTLDRTFLGNPSLFTFGPDGTTPPVEADGVSLMGDAFEGLELGAELVVNGDFSSDAGWTLGAGWSIIGGRAIKTAGTSSTCFRPMPLISGRPYLVEIEIAAITASTFTPLFSGVAGLAGLARNSAGTFRQIMVATAAHTTLVIQATAATAGEIERISVREVLNLPAFQNTAAARPVRAVAPREVRNLLAGTDALATQTVAVTAAEHRLSFRGTGTVTLTGASTSGPLVGTGPTDIVGLTFTPTAGNLTLTVSGAVELAQLELGSARSAYQSVSVGRNTITEAGVPGFPYLSLDGSDDALAKRVVEGGTYSLLVPGRRGIYYDPNVVIAPNTTITTGPLSVNANGVRIPQVPAGLLRATSTVPWRSTFPLASPAVLLKPDMTQDELNRVVRYYQRALGAGGLLEEGPELLAEPVTLSDWTPSHTVYSYAANVVTLTNDGTGFGAFQSPLFSVPAGAVAVRVQYVNRVAARARVTNQANANLGVNMSASSLHVQFVGGQSQIRLTVFTDNNTNGAEFFIDTPLSMKFLIAEALL
jgi:hypothetical protein